MPNEMQTWSPVNDIWSSKGSNLITHGLDEVLLDVIAVAVAFMEAHICVNPLSLDVMVISAGA